MGDASCVPALLEAAVKGEDTVSAAALETLASLQDKSVDAELTGRLAKAEAEGAMRAVLIDLAGRRRIAAAAPALWRAADDQDMAVRAAALGSLGAVVGTAELPKLIARLGGTKDNKEAAALDKRFAM